MILDKRQVPIVSVFFLSTEMKHWEQWQEVTYCHIFHVHNVGVFSQRLVDVYVDVRFSDLPPTSKRATIVPTIKPS